MRKLAVLILALLALSTHAYAESKWPMTIRFRPVDNPEITAFAVIHLRGEIRTSSEAEWVAAVKEHALYAEIDIDDDGVPERFLQFNWLCGTVGCSTFIFKRTDKAREETTLQGKGSDFKNICFISITGNDPQTYLLKKKENGYHLIQTENRFVIHWNIKDKYGKPWCWRDQ